MQIKSYAILCIVLAESCTPYMKPPKHAEELFHMSISERMAQIKKYPLEEQYDLYLYYNTVVHPPEIWLADPITEPGHVIVPFIKNKLSATKDDIETSLVILMLHEMALLKRYDFSKDTILTSLMKQKVDSMKSGSRKDWMLKLLQQIDINQYTEDDSKLLLSK